MFKTLFTFFLTDPSRTHFRPRLLKPLNFRALFSLIIILLTIGAPIGTSVAAAAQATAGKTAPALKLSAKVKKAISKKGRPNAALDGEEPYERKRVFDHASLLSVKERQIIETELNKMSLENHTDFFLFTDEQNPYAGDDQNPYAGINAYADAAYDKLFGQDGQEKDQDVVLLFIDMKQKIYHVMYTGAGLWYISGKREDQVRKAGLTQLKNGEYFSALETGIKEIDACFRKGSALYAKKRETLITWMCITGFVPLALIAKNLDKVIAKHKLKPHSYKLDKKDIEADFACKEKLLETYATSHKIKSSSKRKSL